MKGPVLEIKKRLSEQMSVVECSEFRTSKLCLDCGRAAKFYNYGVSYCVQRDHRMANRDVVAEDWCALSCNEEGIGLENSILLSIIL